MKMKIIIIGLLCCFATKLIHGQTLNRVDSISRAKAQNTVTNNLKISPQSNYLLFSIQDKWYLIIVKKDGMLCQYYINSDTSKLKPQVTKKSKVIKSNPILRKAFKKGLYHREYITFNSPFYKNRHAQAEGNLTYFYLYEDGIKYGEARLSVFIEPNPIDHQVYDYLRNTLLKIISKQ
jgi:hypothetical protein